MTQQDLKKKKNVIRMIFYMKCDSRVIITTKETRC